MNSSPQQHNKKSLSLNFINKNIMLSFMVKALIGSVLMAVAAQITIPLPLVPITGQTLALCILALSLGSKVATASMVLYLIEGALGLPVFANASFGLATLAGPSGGYLLGFIPAAYLMGKFADKGCVNSFFKTSVAVFLGTAITFVFGLAQLSLYIPVTQLLDAGLYPFIAGGIIKGLIATIIVPYTVKLTSRK